MYLFPEITNQQKEINYCLWEPHDVYIDMNHFIMEYAKYNLKSQYMKAVFEAPTTTLT